MKSFLVAAAAFGAAWFFLNRMGGAQNSAADVVMIEANLALQNLTGADVANMTLSDAGLQAIAAREGFSARRYKDANGYSIGYGHFIQVGESFGEPISQGEARALLLADTEIAQKTVRAYVKVPLTNAQFDALTSLVFNIGAGNFKKSRALAALNAGDYTGAANEAMGFNKSGGVYLAALDARRTSEYNQFWA